MDGYGGLGVAFVRTGEGRGGPGVALVRTGEELVGPGVASVRTGGWGGGLCKSTGQPAHQDLHAPTPTPPQVDSMVV